jgi:ankyrin repeat protein
VEDHEYRDDMRTLLERKTLDINAEGEKEETIFCTLRSKGGHRDFVLLLLEHGADPNLRDAKSGNGRLQYSICAQLYQKIIPFPTALSGWQVT